MNYTSREVYEFISKNNNDPIVERKICTVSGNEFAVFQSDLDFYNKISPTFAGQKFQIPTPTLCPEERQRRRLMFRNERKLYKRKCDATGDNIISMYSPDKNYRVYDQKFRRSDNRDPMEYGIPFEYNKTFSEQFNRIMISTPKINLSNDNMSENSVYTNQTTYQKNCYMTFDADYDEDVIYSNSIKYSKRCLDCSCTYYSELCYETVNCTKCISCHYCVECETSNDLFLCNRCIGCSFCFDCVNLTNKNYCIQNIQYSKEEYIQLVTQKKKDFLDNIKSYKSNLQNKGLEKITRGTYKIQDIGSNSNNVAYTNNCQFCNNIGHGKDLKYCSSINNSESCYDFDIRGLDCSYVYECVTTGENAYHVAFNIECWGNINNLFYSHYCFSCHDCFGCVSLKNKSYCIFNKQYTKEEYEIQVAKIIAHMQSTGERGEFFHPSLSPFGYNETVANEYFPLSKQEAIVRGYKWQDKTYDPIIPEGAKVIDFRHPERSEGSSKQQSLDSSLHSEGQADDILKAIFVCEISGRPYRIIKQELEFYRKHNLLLPRKHPDIRHEERMKLRPGRTLYLRNCDKCTNEMLSIYAPKEVLLEGDAKYEGKVYCESCYQKKVYA